MSKGKTSESSEAAAEDRSGRKRIEKVLNYQEVCIMFEIRPYRRNNNPSTYNPFREMDDFERAFFGEPFGSFFRSGDIAEFKTDITDEGDHYLLEADLPGFDKKDIHLDINGDTLTINAERHCEKKSKDKDKYVHIERSYGKYAREFDVSAVDVEKIKAKYNDGVLTLTLPKKQEILPASHRLEIE